MTRPYRSALYIPASKERALRKGRDLACDAILFDLEDAVAPDEKPAARETLARALREGGFGTRARIVRINALDTPWGLDDALSLSGLPCDGVLLPKVGSAGEVDRLARLTAHPVWAMIETPAGVLNAPAICAHPRLAGVVMGTNDLAKDLRSRSGAGRWPLVPALAQTLLAARSAGRVAIDGVWNAFGDALGLEEECRLGRDMGFDGKSLIHPDQIAVANRCFSPSLEEIALARRLIAAHSAAVAAGQGVAVVDGRIVENLHIVTATAILDMAKAVGAQGGDPTEPKGEAT